MKIKIDGTIEEVYNGKGATPWENAGKVQKNGQRSISLLPFTTFGEIKAEI